MATELVKLFNGHQGSQGSKMPLLFTAGFTSSGTILMLKGYLVFLVRAACGSNSIIHSFPIVKTPGVAYVSLVAHSPLRLFRKYSFRFLGVHIQYCL